MKWWQIVLYLIVAGLWFGNSFKTISYIPNNLSNWFVFMWAGVEFAVGIFITGLAVKNTKPLN